MTFDLRRESGSTEQISNDRVAAYYDATQFFYSRFWSSSALHYGFWYEGTKSLAEAIVNTNKFVADVLEVNSQDLVLDAGCGVGGTSLYIAESTGARVEGITLSDVQLAIARKSAAKSAANGLLNFSRQDYNSTIFEDSSFSKLFGIESICHANRKSIFLAEAYRLLKPRGRITVVDAFLTKGDLNPEEEKIYRKVIDGWAIPNLSTQTQFSEFLAEAGFKNIEFYNMQRCVERSIALIYRNSLFTCPINFVRSRLGLARENLASWYQKPLFERKIAVYGVFVADKEE